MEPGQPERTQCAGAEALVLRYRHLHPVHFPYPGLHCLREDFGQAEYEKAANAGCLPGNSLVVTLAAPGRAASKVKGFYVSGLRNEMALYGRLFGRRAKVQQWDFGTMSR